MSSEEIKQEVKGWIAAGCDYESGVELYRKFGRNKVLMNVFPGRESIYANKLMYELCKSVGIQSSVVNPIQVKPEKIESTENKKPEFKIEKNKTLKSILNFFNSKNDTRN